MFLSVSADLLGLWKGDPRWAWSDYIEALEEQLTVEQLQILRREVVDRARTVAAAAGGFLGLKTISDSEERALARLEAAFDAGASRTDE